MLPKVVRLLCSGVWIGTGPVQCTGPSFANAGPGPGPLQAAGPVSHIYLMSLSLTCDVIFYK